MSNDAERETLCASLRTDLTPVRDGATSALSLDPLSEVLTLIGTESGYAAHMSMRSRYGDAATTEFGPFYYTVSGRPTRSAIDLSKRQVRVHVATNDCMGDPVTALVRAVGDALRVAGIEQQMQLGG